MSKIAIAFGVDLVLLGIILFAGSGLGSPTALIPSGFGLVLAVCGVMALDESKRMHAMHGAALIGLVGFVMPLVMLVPKLLRGAELNQRAATGQVAMSVLCGIFLAMCIESFISVRRARKEREAEGAKAIAEGAK